jgi:hypothetical protein
MGIVVGAVVSIAHWTSDALEGGGAHVELVVAEPLNRPAEMTSGGFLQSRASTPQVDLTLRNTGDEPTLLTEARITVEDSAWLPVCIVPGAGPVPIAGRYSLMLPFLPRSDERVLGKALHDQIPVNGWDRLKLYFQAPQFGEDANLYALHVELFADDGKDPIDAGRFVLGVPDAPYRNGEILPEDNYLLRHGGVYGSRPASVWCYRHNLSEMRRLLARPGQRTAEIAGLADFLPARAWAGFSHGVDARQAVPALLGDQYDIYGPTVAVYAAQRTGDPALITKVRQRAAALLLQRAEDALGPAGMGPMGALVTARAALNLSPSASARELAARGEAGWLEVEEEQEEAVMQGISG